MDVLNRITELRLARNWTEYQLAARADLPQSTISTWYRKNMMPTIPSIERICAAFNMTMSEFFLEDENSAVNLTSQQIRLLEYATRLTPQQCDKLLEFLDQL